MVIEVDSSSEPRNEQVLSWRKVLNVSSMIFDVMRYLIIPGGTVVAIVLFYEVGEPSRLPQFVVVEVFALFSWILHYVNSILVEPQLFRELVIVAKCHAEGVAR